jgi:hypothetical protein
MNGRGLERRCRPSARAPMMRVSSMASGADQMRRTAAAVHFASSVLPVAQTRAALRQRFAAAEVAAAAIPHLRSGADIGSACGAPPRRHPQPRRPARSRQGRCAAYEYPRKVRTADTLADDPTGEILWREILPPADPEEG